VGPIPMMVLIFVGKKCTNFGDKRKKARHQCQRKSRNRRRTIEIPTPEATEKMLLHLGRCSWMLSYVSIQNNYFWFCDDLP